MQEKDQTWTVGAITKHLKCNAPMVHQVIERDKIPVYQRIGNYKLYDHRLLSAVRAEIAYRKTPEFKAAWKAKRLAALLVGAQKSAEVRKAQAAAKQAAKAPAGCGDQGTDLKGSGEVSDTYGRVADQLDALNASIERLSTAIDKLNNIFTK